MDANLPDPNTHEELASRSRLSRLAWLPVPLLALVIAGLWIADLRTVYESRALMVLLNLFFTWLASLCICLLTARGFLGSGQPGLLMFGCGSLLWGVTSLAAAVMVDRVNPTITVHNVGVFGAAFCHLVGLLWRGRLPRPGRWLVVGYAGALLTAALIVWAAMAGLTPVFFVQGQGGTPIRQVVLLSAIAMFAWVAWQMIYKFRRQSGAFYYWYGLGLALVATGLTGVVLLIGPRRDPGLDEQAHAISRQRLPVHRGLHGGAGNWHMDAFAGGSGGSLARERVPGGISGDRTPLRLGAALRPGGRGGGGGDWVAAGADGVDRPRIAHLHHVLPGGDGGGVAGRFRAGLGGDGIGGPGGGILDSAAGRTVRHRIARGPPGAGDLHRHGPVHERGRRTLPAQPAQGRRLRS